MNRFGKLDEDVAMRTDINLAAKVVYAMLRMFENTKTGQCNPGQKTLSASCGLPRETINRAIKELVKIGKIKVLGKRPNRLSYTFPNVTRDHIEKGVPNVTRDHIECDERSHSPLIMTEKTKEKTNSTVRVNTSKKSRTKKPYQPSSESQKCLQSWERHRRLPNGIDRDIYHKAFDDLHRLNGVPWDGRTGIYAICKWAVAQWEAVHIQAPSKLRKPSKAYPELKTYQIIQGQIDSSSSEASALGTSDELPPPTSADPNESMRDLYRQRRNQNGRK